MRAKTILSKTKLLGKYRKMDGGGPFDPDSGKYLGDYSDQAATINPNQSVSPSSGGISASAFGAGASLGTDAINAFSTTNKYGVTSNGAAIGKGALKDAAAGAAIGSAIPGVGTLIGAGVGAVIGGVTGFIGNKKAKKVQDVAIKAGTAQEQEMRDARSGAQIAANPNIKYGNLAASYYAMGGTMKGTIPQPPRLKKPLTAVQPAQRLMPNVAEVPGRQLSHMANGGLTTPGYNQTKLSKPYRPYIPHVPNPVKTGQMAEGGKIHIKKSHEGLFTKYKQRTGKTTAEAKQSSDPHIRKMATLAQNASHWAKGETGGDITRMGNILGHKYKTSDPSYSNPALVMGANGGDIKRLSSTNAKVEGPSHADGGVKIPGAGVELEGDETLNGDFVFSKKLGFAQQHEKIANAMGRIEKKPDTVVNRNTAKALDRQTQLLKVYQEATKQQMGLPNEIDNTAQQMQANQQGGSAVPSTGTLKNGGKIKPKFSHELLHNENTDPTTMKNGGKLVKYATGGPTGPGPKSPVPVITQTGDLPANNDPYWKTHPLLTQHDPTIDESTLWGNPLKPVKAALTIKDVLKGTGETVSPIAPVRPSDKALGQSNTYLTPGSQPQVKTPDVIASPSGRYKNGGRLRKMADGGDPVWGNKMISTIPQFMKGTDIPTATTSPYTVNSLNTVPGTQSPNQDPLNVNQYQTTGTLPKQGKAASVYARTTGRGSKVVTPSVIPSPNPLYPLPKVTDTGLPALPELDKVNSNIPPATQQAATADNGTAAQSPLSTSSGRVSGTGSSGKSSVMDKINGAADKISPFLPNIAEAFRKLPLPNIPVKESEIAPALVDYSASRAEAVRQTRGANKAAEENLNTGAAVAATRASNLAQQERAVGQINEAENNTNAGIRNQTNQVNLQVRARNNSLQNEYNRELVERQLKGQDLASQNLASVSEKVQGMNRDSKLYDLEDQKMMLEALKDTTGASYRGARTIFAKHLSKDDLANLDDHFGNIAKQDAADRADQRALTAAQIDAAKRTSANPVMDKYKTSTQILGRKSSVETEAERKAEKQAQTRREDVQ